MTKEEYIALELVKAWLSTYSESLSFAVIERKYFDLVDELKER